MKQRNYLAIMVIALSLFAFSNAQEFDFSGEKKVTCQSLTLAVASCKKGDETCVEYKAKRYDENCPELAHLVRKAILKTKKIPIQLKQQVKLAKQNGAPLSKESKREFRAMKVVSALTPLKRAAKACPTSRTLHKVVSVTLKAVKINPKLALRLAKTIRKMPKMKAPPKLANRKGSRKLKGIRKFGKAARKAAKNAKKAGKKAKKSGSKKAGRKARKAGRKARKLVKKAKTAARKSGKKGKAALKGGKKGGKKLTLKQKIARAEKKARKLIKKAEAAAKKAKSGNPKDVARAKKLAKLAKKAIKRVEKLKSLAGKKGKSAKRSGKKGKAARRAGKKAGKASKKAFLKGDKRSKRSAKRSSRNARKAAKKAFRTKDGKSRAQLARIMNKNLKKADTYKAQARAMRKQARRILAQAKVSKAAQKKAAKLLAKAKILSKKAKKHRRIAKAADKKYKAICSQTIEQLRKKAEKLYKKVDKLKIKANKNSIYAAGEVKRARKTKNKMDKAEAREAVQIAKETAE
jgi:hypothetical protein